MKNQNDTEEKNFNESIIKSKKQKVKIPKEQELKNRKKIFFNLLIAIFVMIYLVGINLIYGQVQDDGIIKVLKISTIIFLIIGLLLIEISNKKGKASYLVSAVEALVFSAHNLTTMHTIKLYDFDFKAYIITSSYIFSIYYVLKTIIIYTKGRRDYLKSLSDISDIVKKEEPLKKEATKKSIKEVEENDIDIYEFNNFEIDKINNNTTTIQETTEKDADVNSMEVNVTDDIEFTQVKKDIDTENVPIETTEENNTGKKQDKTVAKTTKRTKSTTSKPKTKQATTKAKKESVKVAKNEEDKAIKAKEELSKKTKNEEGKAIKTKQESPKKTKNEEGKAIKTRKESSKKTKSEEGKAIKTKQESSKKTKSEEGKTIKTKEELAQKTKNEQGKTTEEINELATKTTTEKATTKGKKRQSKQETNPVTEEKDVTNNEKQTTTKRQSKSKVQDEKQVEDKPKKRGRPKKEV